MKMFAAILIAVALFAGCDRNEPCAERDYSHVAVCCAMSPAGNCVLLGQGDLWTFTQCPQESMAWMAAHWPGVPYKHGSCDDILEHLSAPTDHGLRPR